MAISQVLTNSFKGELLQGGHAFTPNSTGYNIALFTNTTTLDASTEAYSVFDGATGLTGEVANGNGYTAGGVTLSVSSVGESNGVGYVTFNDATWASSTFTARGALIYKNTGAKNSVMVLDFGADKTVTNGTFRVDFGQAFTNETAVIQIR